jgi:hypothetical protein
MRVYDAMGQGPLSRGSVGCFRLASLTIGKSRLGGLVGVAYRGLSCEFRSYGGSPRSTCSFGSQHGKQGSGETELISKGYKHVKQ